MLNDWEHEHELQRRILYRPVALSKTNRGLRISCDSQSAVKIACFGQVGTANLVAKRESIYKSWEYWHGSTEVLLLWSGIH